MKPIDLEEAFIIYKNALKEIVNNSFGWNEEFQKNRFLTRYDLNWFYWLEIDLKRIGYICMWQSKEEVHLSLIFILPEHQRKSYGKKVMNFLIKQAQEKNQKITLSSFKLNKNAINFYQKLTFQVVKSDDHFIDLIFKPK